MVSTNVQNEKEISPIAESVEDIESVAEKFSEDTEKEKRINRLIEEDIKKVSEWVTPDKYGRKFDVGVTWYKITYKDEKLISIVYSGWTGRIQPGSGLSAAMMATTVDCERETVLELQDVVSDFDRLCRKNFWKN